MKIGNYNISWKHLVKEGRTICSIYKDEKLIAAGIAHLSEKDQYNRAVGRKVSLTRGLKDAGMPRHERTFIWDTLRSKGINFRN